METSTPRSQHRELKDSDEQDGKEPGHGNLGPGLVFFPADRSAGHRRRRIVFSVVYLLIASALLWPVYPWMASFVPPLFGLPPAFVWVVAVLVAAFMAILALYLSEDPVEEV